MLTFVFATGTHLDTPAYPSRGTCQFGVYPSRVDSTHGTGTHLDTPAWDMLRGVCSRDGYASGYACVPVRYYRTAVSHASMSRGVDALLGGRSCLEQRRSAFTRVLCAATETEITTSGDVFTVSGKPEANVRLSSAQKNWSLSPC